MFKRMKLASKLAFALGIVLAVIFALLILVTALFAGNAITNSVSGELTAISDANGDKVQQIFDAADSAASDMQSYLETAYKTAESDPEQNMIPADPEAAALCQSSIYNRVLTSLNYDVENYLRETARNTAANNDDLAGVGVMFEPYKFQDDMKDYAFYVSSATANEEVKPFGAYEDYSKETYYGPARDSKSAVVTDPYDFEGARLISYASPILSGGEVQGVVMADISVDNFSKIQAANEKFPTMYSTIYNNEGTIIYDTEDAADIGHNVSEFTPKEADLTAIRTGMAGSDAFSVVTTREDGRKVARFYTPISAAGKIWWSQTALDQKDMEKSVRQTIMLLILFSAAALALLIGVTVSLLHKMLKPIQPIVKAAEHISEGRLDVELSVSSEDEIGVLSRAFVKMSGNLKGIIVDVDYLLGRIADGDFTAKSRDAEHYVGDYSGILQSMRRLVGNLSTTLTEINAASEQVSAGSEQVSSGAQALAQGATEQASSVEELAATINEISTQVRETAGNAAAARETTELAGNAVEASNRRMQEMIDAMSEISAKSAEIGKIIKTIEDIAFQTNILALNAAVEAARAGAAGKGFAVVADEVRSLASKSAEASKGTSALIEGTVSAVEKGTSIANDTARSLVEVVERTHTTMGLVNKIADASGTQSASIAQVTQGIDQISSVVQTNSATAEESAAASEELSGQAQMLKNLVGRFRLKDSDHGAV